MVRLVALALVFALLGSCFLRAAKGRYLDGRDPASRAVASHIAAARRGDCDTVWNGYTERTRQVAVQTSRVPGPQADALARRSLCQYATDGDLGSYLPETVRLEEGSASRAVVGAKYTYDRFFGFFGTGKSRGHFLVLKEAGAWRIDVTESIDPNSPTNLDEAAMHRLHQAVTAQRDVHRANGTYTLDQAVIRDQLPGYEFGPIEPGVVSGVSTPGTTFVATTGDTVCLSTRSETSTRIMIKLGSPRNTWQWGDIPAVCDTTPLGRTYTGTSSRIRRG
jgi:hypothetical protein